MKHIQKCRKKNIAIRWATINTAEKERGEKMVKVKVILNEQHQLMQEQQEILNNRFGEWEIVSVHQNGWTLDEQKKIGEDLLGNTVVFASPIPFLMKHLAYCSGYGEDDHTQVLVFHNDERQKKELPNGKIIQVVAETGWQLV